MLNRPAKLNALDRNLAGLLEQEVQALRSKKDVRALVITGEGQYFSAGGDLTFLLERAKDTFANNVAVMLNFYSKFLSVRLCLSLSVLQLIESRSSGRSRSL